MTTPYAARPVWSEGMLMCPQHMQQQDLYHEQFVEARLQALSPIPWGILSLQLDPAALRAGTLQLLQFRGVLPDGTPLQIEPGSALRPPARPIGPHFSARTEALPVHLALPLLREGVANYASDANAAHRYRAAPRRVYDLTRARNERELEVSEPAPVLLFDSEPRADFAALPIAEVVRDEAGGFRTSDTFIPPALALRAAPNLLQDLHDIISRAVTRRRTLTEERRGRSSTKADLTFRDHEKTIFLHALNAALPWLKHCGDTGTTHPLTVYEALARLAGALMTVSAEGDPTELPGFEYSDLRATFHPLVAELRRLLAKEFDPTCIELPLRVNADTSWVGEFVNERLLLCTSFVLVVESSGDLVKAQREIPEVFKIASWQRIGPIVKNNALGVPMRPVVAPPPEIPVQPRQVYFMLDLSDAVWLEAVAERRIAVYVRPPYDPKSAKVRLYGIPRKEG